MMIFGRLVHCQVTTLVKLVAHICLYSPSNGIIRCLWPLAKWQWWCARKVRFVNLMSHWPCVMDSVLSTYELKG